MQLLNGEKACFHSIGKRAYIRTTILTYVSICAPLTSHVYQLFSRVSPWIIHRRFSYKFGSSGVLNPFTFVSACASHFLAPRSRKKKLSFTCSFVIPPYNSRIYHLWIDPRYFTTDLTLLKVFKDFIPTYLVNELWSRKSWYVKLSNFVLLQTNNLSFDPNLMQIYIVLFYSKIY